MKNVRTIATAVALAALSTTAVKAQTVIGGGKGGVSFPITISQPGSYRLAANLVVPAGTHGIVVNVPGVTIDLNGFSITGPASCTGPWASMSCTNATHSGVWGPQVTLRNGRIGGFKVGAQLGSDSVVEDVIAERNSVAGVILGERSVVRRVAARYNGNSGIVAISGLVQDAVVSQSYIGVTLHVGVLQSSFIIDTTYGVYAGGTTGVRETAIHAGNPFHSNKVSSMGNNLCNASPC